MLRKLTHTFSYNLVSLLAVLFVAAGMPLLHPAFHSHLEHHHTSENYGAVHSFPVLDEAKDHQCPICDFQATRQYFSGVPAPAVSAGEPFKNNLPPMVLFQGIKAFPTQAEPRAPPYFS